MTAEELQSEWRLWDVVNNVGSPRPYSPASASFCKFVVDVVIPREREKAIYERRQRFAQNNFSDIPRSPSHI